MDQYNPKIIEKKWQEEWEKKGLSSTPVDATRDNKMYVLPQLPYPSGSGLHAGHAEVYAACDIYARFLRMQGKKVLQVFGLDSFGLPAENYAIKTNVHPRETINKAGEMFCEQVRSLGISVDWDRFVRSSDPNYYQWTQWFFLLMYKRGLAYRKKQSVNWCDSCKTVLANEQVTPQGMCERCETVVIQKEMEQWYLKITEYAERLLEGLDRIDWPEETKQRQRNWIGRSEGAEILFRIPCGTCGKKPVGQTISCADDKTVAVFTTRPDTIFGTTYLVLAPEHPFIQNQKSKIKNWNEVQAYIEKTGKKTELDRQIEKEKTGVELEGIQAINPVNGEGIPIWIADYVLATYGTGAIMAVPAHDERDFAFAKKFGLKIRQVVDPTEYFVAVDKANVDFKKLNEYRKTIFVNEIVFGAEGQFTLAVRNKKIMNKIVQNCITRGGVKGIYSSGEESVQDWYKTEEEKEYRPFLDEATAINSDFLNDLETKEAKEKIIQHLEAERMGKRHIQYKLRDWSVSRQRFWGAPIPMIYNEQRAKNKKHYLFLHGYRAHGSDCFRSWLKHELEKQGHIVWAEDLPNTDKPHIDEQVDFVLRTADLSEDTVIVAHSHGGGVAFRLLEKTKQKIAKVVLVDCFYKPEFTDKKRPDVEKSDTWTFDFEKIRAAADEFVIVHDRDEKTISKKQAEEMAELLGARLIFETPQERHFTGAKEPRILEESLVTGLHPVSEHDLPVLLPDDVDFKPTGQSPLTYSEEFQKGVEEQYGKGWKREVDTLDTFMCSSWYYYRYLDPHNDTAFASKEALKRWMPVDFYLGGEEHVNGHLLYSRFFTKVLYDAGYIDFDEPFLKHRHQGLILGEDNRKMSKRWGNVINPTDVVNTFGADTVRMYEMFMGPLEQTKPWSTNGVKGVRRFLDKVWRLHASVVRHEPSDSESAELDSLVHKTVKKVTKDLHAMSFNTAIAKMMELVNAMQKEEKICQQHFEFILLLLSPFVPHIAEELWAMLGHTTSITLESWPVFDPSKIVDEMVMLVLQVNGKMRGSIEVGRDISDDDAKTTALCHPNVVKWLGGKEPKKIIVVPGKLVSIVV